MKRWVAVSVASAFVLMYLAMAIAPAFALVGDVNGDGKVRVDDVFLVVLAFGSNVGEPRYDPRCDLNGDGKIRVDDLFIVVQHFGEHV
jgi:Ca2+-binding EF-hand superfamily protein